MRSNTVHFGRLFLTAVFLLLALSCVQATFAAPVLSNSVQGRVCIRAGTAVRSWSIDIKLLFTDPLYFSIHQSSAVYTPRIATESFCGLYVLDPRFTLTDTQLESFKKTGVTVEETLNGGTSISWVIKPHKGRMRLPVLQIEIKARGDFPGGNDVPASQPQSGVYQYGEKLWNMPTAYINVPLNSRLHDVETEVFLGQPVPKTLDGRTIESLMTEDAPLNFYGQEETGTVAYTFAKLQGGNRGESIPESDQSYVYAMRFTPSTSGEQGVGPAIHETLLTGEYRVRVIPGTVRAKYILGEAHWPPEACLIFKLSGEQVTRYQRVRLKDRDEDGKFIKLEAVFDRIPYGDYTLTCVYSPSPGIRRGTAISGNVGLDLSMREAVVFFSRDQICPPETEASAAGVVAERK